MEDREVIEVFVVGPAPGQTGGVSSVMANLEAAISEESRIHLRFIETLSNGRWSLLAFLKAAIRLISLLRNSANGGPIVVHLNVASRGSTYRKWAVGRIVRFFEAPYVCHLHGARHELFFAESPRVVRWMTKDLFGGAAKVIVLGQVWRTYVIEKLSVDEGSVVVVPNGVGKPTLLACQTDSGTTRVVFSGRLESRKGIPELLAACDLLYDEKISFELLLMGDCRDSVLLKNCVIRPYVRVTGWLPSDEVMAQLSEADLFVLPSHFEGLPMAMVEAMSLGVPILVTAVGAVPDVVRDGIDGALVQPGDISALAENLKQLIGDDQLRARLGQAAQNRWAELLTADRMAVDISKVWREASEWCFWEAQSK